MLAGVIRHLDAGAAHVVGVSVGGMIAQALALLQPELVRSLVLVHTLCTFPDAVRGALRERARVAREDGMSAIAPMSLARWFTPAFRTARPNLMDRATKSMLAQDGAFHGAMWDMIAGLDLQARLRAVACPTLVVTGARERPRADGRRHPRRDAARAEPFETPAEFNALPFLNRPDPTRALHQQNGRRCFIVAALRRSPLVGADIDVERQRGETTPQP